MPTELLTEESIAIWFYRMFSVCRKCGTILHLGNCYERDDTRSHLHTYCKPCFIELQKYRNSEIVKPPRQYYYLINKKRPVFFDTKAEKEKYLADRKSLAKFSYIKDDYSSRVGCTESYGSSNLLCEQCGGTLRCNDHGELECTICHLIADYPFLEVERNLAFDKNPYKQNYYKDTSKISYGSRESSYYYESDEFNDGSFDVYYSKAYSKKLRKDNAGNYND